MYLYELQPLIVVFRGLGRTRGVVHLKIIDTARPSRLAWLFFILSQLFYRD